MNIIYRELRKSDFDSVKSIINESFGLYRYVENESVLKSYKRMHQIYHELLAGSGQKFDGVLTLFAVTQECRGFGVGKELLHRLFAYQKERNTSNIYLYTDSTCNYGFYESQGFKRLGEQRMQITRDHKVDTLDVYLYGYKIE